MLQRDARTIDCALATTVFQMLENQAFVTCALTEPQLRAARLVAMGQSLNNISDQLSIDRTTLYRWRKNPSFVAELERLVDSVKEDNKTRIVRDVSEIHDIILLTLFDVAENDSSGSARVSAARVLIDMVERVEDRASKASQDVMKDQSSEIRLLLKDIKEAAAV